MKLYIAFLSLFIIASFHVSGADLITDYSNEQCSGSSMPYPAPLYTLQVPDSLRPIMINHVARPGSSYLTNIKDALALERALSEAEEQKTLTKRGKQFYDFTEEIMDICIGRWGILDTLGKAEEQGIAMRMYADFAPLFKNGKIKAISSYLPRAIMSMYEYTHQIARLDDRIEIITISGRCNDPILRFFDNEKIIPEQSAIQEAINQYGEKVLPEEPLARIFGSSFDYKGFDKYQLVTAMYSLVSGASAMELSVDPSSFFSNNELNALWSYFNLKQYLEYSASYISDTPAQLSVPLLKNIIQTSDSLLLGKDVAPIQFRFGDAETLISLLSLIQFPKCRYISYDLDNVNRNWLNFDIVPMAANFRMILFKSKQTNNIYARFDLNERSIPLIEDSDEIYIPWEEARNYLLLRSGLWFSDEL